MTARLRESANCSRLAFSRAEVAEMLGISIRTVDNWVHVGVLRAVKIGRMTRIPATEIDGLLKPARNMRAESSHLTFEGAWARDD